MFRIYDCITAEHDINLVLLAAAVCVFGWIATAIISNRAVSSDRVILWRALLGLCAGATVWATHFIAILAFRTSLPVNYDAGLTVASLVVGAVVIGSGFALAARDGGRPASRLTGGLCVGTGVSLLHYLGMAAVQLPGLVSYDLVMVALSIAASVAFGAWGLEWMFAPQRRYGRAVATLLLVLMTVALHFTGMAAVQLDLGWSGLTQTSGLSREVMAVGVSLAAVVTLVIGVSGAILDQSVSARLAMQAERFRTLADGAFEALLVVDGDAIVDANAAAREMLGLSDELEHHALSHFLGERTETGQHTDLAERTDRYERELLRHDGSRFHGEMRRREIHLADGRPGELLAVRDLTRHKESEARIAHLALHDALTDLPNRRLFIEMAENARAHAHRYGGPFALLALDIDDFKLINDVHGHAAGDELIRQVGSRITGTLREADVVARFGGDEFAMIEPSTSQPRQAMALAQRLVERMKQPFRLADAEVVISVSIGIALFPSDGDAIEELLRNADTAMYRAKADGKATYRFFEADMDAALEARRRLETRLRRAINEQRLTISYQPLVSSETHVPLGFEALVRWHDEELGQVTPGEFIPVAEESGLIVPLGAFVLDRACRDAMSWSLPLRVAVNLSVAQFKRKGLVELVKRTLEETGLPADRLELEITESLLIDNREDALRILNELKALGVHIAMDDFGTGYSSLSYLQSFSFDKIKIDRSFVSGLEHTVESSGIVNAVVSMGKSLCMRVVAEGVESSSQAEILRGLECDELQGFYFARPMADDAVAEYLATIAGALEEQPRRAG